MTKTFSVFLLGVCAGVSATLALSPTVRRDALDRLHGAEEGVLNTAATQKKAIVNSVEAARSTYNATVKSAGFQTAPMEAN